MTTSLSSPLIASRGHARSNIPTRGGDTSQSREPITGPARVWTLHDRNGYVTHGAFDRVFARALGEPGRGWRMWVVGKFAEPEPCDECGATSCRCHDDGPDQDGGAA